MLNLLLTVGGFFTETPLIITKPLICNKCEQPNQFDGCGIANRAKLKYNKFSDRSHKQYNNK